MIKKRTIYDLICDFCESRVSDIEKGVLDGILGDKEWSVHGDGKKHACSLCTRIYKTIKKLKSIEDLK